MSNSTNYEPEKMIVAPPTPTHYNSSTTNPQLRCKCVIFTSLLILLVCIFLAIAIITLVFPTKAPNVRVDSVLIPGFNTSSSTQILATFVVRNPNKRNLDDCEFWFGPFCVSISSQDDFLGGKVIAPFTLVKRTERKISVTFEVQGTVLNDVYGRSFRGQNSGEVNFNFKLKSMLQLAGAPRAGQFDASCEDVLVKFTPDTRVGTLSGGPKKCKVYWG